MSQNKAFSTPFILAVLCIYFSYFLHGISVITLAQNMSSLAEKFSTDNAGIAYLISGIGLGRLISILFFGVISDKFGRRAVILMAVIMYLLFFFGIPACPNLTLAYGLAADSYTQVRPQACMPAGRNCWEGRSVRASSLLRQLAKGGCAARRLSWVTPGFSQSRRCKTTASESVIMVIAVSCVKLLSAHNSTHYTSRKHKV